MIFFSGKPNKRKSTLTVFREIYSQYGIRGLFAGTTPRLIKVAPACAIMISSFEYGKIFFNRLANQQFSRSSNISESDIQATIEKISTSTSSSSSNKSVSTFKGRQVLSKHNEVL